MNIRLLFTCRYMVYNCRTCIVIILSLTIISLYYYITATAEKPSQSIGIHDKSYTETSLNARYHLTEHSETNKKQKFRRPEAPDKQNFNKNTGNKLDYTNAATQTVSKEKTQKQTKITKEPNKINKNVEKVSLVNIKQKAANPEGTSSAKVQNIIETMHTDSKQKHIEKTNKSESETEGKNSKTKFPDNKNRANVKQNKEYKINKSATSETDYQNQRLDKRVSQDNKIPNLVKATDKDDNKDSNQNIRNESFNTTDKSKTAHTSSKHLATGRREENKSAITGTGKVYLKSIPQSGMDNYTVKSDKPIVLIVGYMRTGSTLVGSILQEYNRTFYAFEPLKSVSTDFKKEDRIKLSYINGTIRIYDKSELRDILMNEIENWLICNIAGISLETLTNPSFLTFSNYLKDFILCYNDAYGRKSLDDINKCLNRVTSKCQKAPLIVLKFIRLRMREAVQLLPYFPNMKIIHLVRDPRGILNSRQKVEGIYSNSVFKLCYTTSHDLIVTRKIQEHYPDRVRILLYENMAEQPLESAKSIAKFVGIEFTQRMKRFVESQTSSESDDCPYCTGRSNSTAVASQWRNELDHHYARYLYRRCKESNTFLGYLQFDNFADQRNFEIPSRSRLEKDNDNLKIFV